MPSQTSHSVGFRHPEAPKVCPDCGSEQLTCNIKEHTFTYGEGPEAVRLSATVPLYSCSACGFEFMTESGAEAEHEAVCRHLGVFTPKEIAALRAKYDLTRSTFAQLTKLGEATLARWERGALIQNSAYDQFLYLLTFPENIKRLYERTSLRPAIRFQRLSLTVEVFAAQKHFDLHPTVG